MHEEWPNIMLNPRVLDLEQPSLLAWLSVAFRCSSVEAT